MDPCHVIGPAQHGLSEDLQQALRESVSGDVGFRSMMGPEGPFLPAGLLNSGNSCFWNALVQALFFSVPQFRSALFQMDMDDLHFKHFSQQQARQTSLPEVLGLMRDLFVEMEMGLTGAIDAGKLYNSIFQRAEEADVSEQMQHFFELASQAAPLKVVCQLFRGELHEHLRGGERRQVPLDFFQLDLCVSKPRSLPDLLEDHVNDVHGSILRRSYALPQVLWLNLDRFRFDRKEMKGRKRRVRVSFPERLCAWMLTDECCVQAPESRETEKSQKSQKSPELSEGRRLAEAAPAESSPAALIWSRQNLQAELLENQQLLQKTTQEEISKSTENQESTEESLLMAERIAERQEELMQSLQALEEQLMRVGEDKGWVYEVQAVIIHKGLLDTGHYFTYARMPSSQCSSTWCCLNDSSVSISSFEEMRKVAAGRSEDIESESEDEAAASLPSLPSLQVAQLPEESLWAAVSKMCGCGWHQSVAAPVVSPDTFDKEELSRELPKSPEPPKPPSPPSQSIQSTEARCLVYTRVRERDRERDTAGTSLDSLDFLNVRHLVPAKLQERIDQANQEVLKDAANRVVAEFARSLGRLREISAAESVDTDARMADGKDDEGDGSDGLLSTARFVFAEAGAEVARAYLLRACWRQRIPWLPEELCPTAMPPDFRMHYGRLAKQLLLDALVHHGLLEDAQLVSRGDSDTFAPSEIGAWLSDRGL